MMRNLLKSLLIAVGLIGLSTGQVWSRDGTVYTVNYPVEYFAQTIAGDDLEVVFPAPPGVDPAEWTPGVGTLLDYQAADLILLNGTGYARWTKGAYLARSRLVDTTAGFNDRLIALDDDEVPHIHGPTGKEVKREAKAFTTWLDLALAREQAKAILDALIRRWPAHATSFKTRHAILDADLAALDAALFDALGAFRDWEVYASHPVYQYLGRRYGIDLHSFHWEPDTTPPPEEWAILDAQLAQRPAKVILWEAEPTPMTQSELARRGLHIVILPTLSNRPAAGDLTSAMKAVIEALHQIATK